MNNIHKHAGAFHNAGIPIIPISYKQKCATISKWQHITLEASKKIVTKQSCLINLGVLCGKKSGFFILDIDTKNDGDNSLKKLLEIHGELPKTLTVATSNGGRHYYFKYPQDLSLKRKIAIVDGIDILADNSYALIPPSIHPSGHEYHFIDEDKFNSKKVLEAPEWLINLITKGNIVTEKKNSHLSFLSKIKEGNRNDSLFKLGIRLIKGGHSLEEVQVFLSSINQTQCDFPLPEEEISNIIRSIKSYQSPIQYEFSPDQKEKLKPLPFPKFDGLMGEIYEHIVQTSNRTQPVLAIAPVISLLGVLASHVYTFNNLAPVFYNILIAPSGMGKDSPLKSPQEILKTLKATSLLGKGAYRSDVAIYDGLDKKRKRLDTIDEASSIFEISNKASSGYQANIPNVLSALWSDTTKLHVGMASKADGNIGRVESPCINIIMGLTNHAFQNSFTSNIVFTGLGGRCLYFFGNGAETEIKRAELEHILSDSAIAKLRGLHQFTNRVHSEYPIPMDDDIKPPEPIKLTPSKKAKELMWEIEKYFFEKSKKLSEDNPLRPIINRSYEYCLRLAILYYISNGKTDNLITEKEIGQAYDFIHAHNHNISIHLPENMALTIFDRDVNKVRKIIAEAGEQGIERSTLLRKVKGKAKDLNEVLNTLFEREEIFSAKDGKTTVYYFSPLFKIKE